MNLALVAAGAIASVPVMAAPVTVSESFSLSALIQGGGSQLNFDIGSFLTQQGLSAGRVVSGQVVVHGFSEASYGETAASAYTGYSQTGSTSHYATGVQYVPGYYASYSYSCRSTWGYRTCYGSYWVPGYSYQYGYSISDIEETRYRDVQHIDAVADKMAVSIGNTTATDTADTRSASTGSYGGRNYEGQTCRYPDGNGNCSYSYRYNRERDTYDAVSGELETSLALDMSALQDLRDDGMLGVSFTALAGQFNLRSINFTLQVDDNAVPEPVGLALTGVALAGALVATRRRRKA